MKILHVAPMAIDRPTGVSVYVNELLGALVSTAETSLALLSSSPYRISDQQSIPRVLYISGVSSKHFNPWRIDECWIRKIESEFGTPDLVHFHDLYEPFQTALARIIKRLNWGYIVSPHGGLQFQAQTRKFLKKLVGNVLFSNQFIQEATAVHVLNNDERVAVMQRYPNSRVFVVPNGVNDSFFQRNIVRPVKDKNELLFGFIGRIDLKHKGIDVLLRAIIKLQEEQASVPKIRFIFAGQFHSREDKKVFNTYLKKLRYPQMVEYKGIVVGEKKQHFLDLLDVFLHTSRYEGMPGAVLEAMARAIPCLVTPGTNMQSIIRECGGGWVCECSVDSIFSALKIILRTPDEFLQRGLDARLFIEKNFLWSQIAEKYKMEVNSIIA